jgi:hypothetical protein
VIFSITRDIFWNLKMFNFKKIFHLLCIIFIGKRDVSNRIRSQNCCTVHICMCIWPIRLWLFLNSLHYRRSVLLLMNLPFLLDWQVLFTIWRFFMKIDIFIIVLFRNIYFFSWKNDVIRGKRLIASSLSSFCPCSLAPLGYDLFIFICLKMRPPWR